MRAVDLFSGLGGFTEGASAAGVDVVWAANHWPAAVRAHSLNHPETMHELQDLRQADWTKLPDYDVMLAAPACPGHSTASQPRRRAYHDAMRATAFAVVDCADVTEPKAIVVENVPNFVRWRLYPLWRQMLVELGYDVEERIVTASRHGVAQRRRRLFLVATRRGVRVPQLVPHQTEPPFEPHLEVTVDERAWVPVDRATPGVRARIEKGRANHGRRFLTQHVTGHPGVPLHEPIRTITTAHSHWNLVDGDHYRSLTMRELARGMGFRESLAWPSDLTEGDVTTLIGNAVCPPVARQLVGAVAEAIA